MGKKLDLKLHQLGAQRFYSTGFADDGVGMDETVTGWMQGLWNTLEGLSGENPLQQKPNSSEICDPILSQVISSLEGLKIPADSLKGLPRELPRYLNAIPLSAPDC
eukprot:Sdes_comp13785_c0_seq2m3290